MDLQTRKLNLIEYLISLTDERIIKVLEDMINKSKPDSYQEFKPFTQQELLERAKKSDKEYLEGNYITQRTIELESKNW